MKVKVFTSPSGAALEQSVNEWLAANPTIAIATVVQSAESREAGSAHTSGLQIILTVFYEEPEEIVVINTEDDYRIGR